MNRYSEWAARYPEAAHALQAVLVPAASAVPANGKSEAAAQQAVRLAAAKTGALSWRNNVGATPARCPDCGAPQQPVRYGLANDSTQLNARMKSSDLILAIPRKVMPWDVGKVIAQFGAVECKRPGWVRNENNEHENAQAAWLALIERVGGFARFSTGELELTT